ncbi:MAG: DNA polymerase IV [Traorella sp.]
MSERVILHCDINHCYAQIEEMKYPELRDVAMAIGGHEESRHGIILTKNDKAKEYHIKTGESLREAYQKCPHLLIIHPHYDDYLYYTEKVKDIYREYSDRVESFGLDEAWIDCSESVKLFGSGKKIAEIIQKRVLEEVGLTVSIGVSFNKIFAKLGSDMIKPCGLVEISQDNYKQKAWNLPASDLLYVGQATKIKLALFGIQTIGDLAQYDVEILKRNLGKIGEILWWFANGYDQSEVALSGSSEDIKSIGNGITTPKDITSFEEAKIVFYVLCESVASRAKEKGLAGKCLSIHLRNKELKSISRQHKFKKATNVTKEMMPIILSLLKKNYDFSMPLRSITLTLSSLVDESKEVQLSLFEDEKQHQKEYDLEVTIDKIRSLYGFNSVKRCSMLVDEELSDFNPKGDHIIFPVGYF